MVSSTVLTLVVIPAIYGLIKGWRLPARSVTALEEMEPLTFREAAE
jgi:Cu(I)/Ag(I) efflux system membrane protein CusA/SilA